MSLGLRLPIDSPSLMEIATQRQYGLSMEVLEQDTWFISWLCQFLVLGTAASYLALFASFP